MEKICKTPRLITKKGRALPTVRSVEVATAGDYSKIVNPFVGKTVTTGDRKKTYGVEDCYPWPGYYEPTPRLGYYEPTHGLTTNDCASMVSLFTFNLDTFNP